MKRILLMITLSVQLCLQSFAQTWKSQYEFVGEFNNGLAQAGKGKKYGFVNEQGKIVVPLKYDYVGLYSEGLALVEANKKVGFVDVNGKEVIEPVYDAAGKFKNGFAVVQKNGKFGYVNKEGRLVIAMIYDSYYDFSEGLLLVKKDEKYGFLNTAGEVAIPLEYEYAQSFSEERAIIYKDGKCGFIEKNGKVIIKPEYEYAESFSNSLAVVVKDGLFGFINREGKTSIPFRYKNASSFHSNGLSRVIAKSESEFGGEDYWFINKNGDNVFSKKYTYATPFMEKFALVRFYSSSIPDEYFFINSNGEQVNNEKYDLLAYTDFSRKLFAVRKDDQYFILDQNGKDVSKYKYQEIVHIGNRFLKIKVNDKYGVFDEDYNLFLDLKYDDIVTRSSPLSKNKQRQIWYKENNKWGIVTMDKSYNSGARYDNAPWTNRDDVVIVNGKYGMLDSTGKELVKPIYDKFDRLVKNISGTYLMKTFRVCANGKCGYMNNEGKIAVPLEYDEVALDVNPYNKLAAVKKNDKWGFINVENAKLVIPCIYDMIEESWLALFPKKSPEFELKGEVVFLSRNGLVGALNKEGIIIVPFEYEYIYTYGTDKDEIEARKMVDNMAYSFFYNKKGELLRKKKFK